MSPAEAEAAFPELFEAARFLRERSPDPSAVKFRCITDEAGNVLLGKLPPPDPAEWVEIGGDVQHQAPAETTAQPYRGRKR